MGEWVGDLQVDSSMSLALPAASCHGVVRLGYGYSAAYTPYFPHYAKSQHSICSRLSVVGLQRRCILSIWWLAVEISAIAVKAVLSRSGCWLMAVDRDTFDNH